MLILALYTCKDYFIFFFYFIHLFLPKEGYWLCSLANVTKCFDDLDGVNSHLCRELCDKEVTRGGGGREEAVRQEACAKVTFKFEVLCSSLSTDKRSQ